ncbi:hypothetical protein ScPMuIL_016133 [Solemya velum]
MQNVTTLRNVYIDRTLRRCRNHTTKAFVLVIVVGIVSALAPNECRMNYEDWKFLNKYSEMENYLKLMRCLSNYCKTAHKGKAFFACIIRHSARIPIPYFVD